MKVRDYMTTDIVFVDKDVDLQYVLDLMKKHDITKIPVVENKKIIGIVTDNLAAFKLGSIRKKDVTASRLHASSVTDKEIDITTPDTDIKTILKKVGEPGPTMLPVIENDCLVGVLTKADLLPLVENTNQISTIMGKTVHTVSPDDRIIHARRVMINENIARIPVVDKGRLIGMVSDIEIAFAFASLKKSFSIGRQKHQLDELIIKDIMRTPAIYTAPSTTIVEAAKLMMKHNIGALPILKNDTIIGIVTRTDLLKSITL